MQPFLSSGFVQFAQGRTIAQRCWESRRRVNRTTSIAPPDNGTAVCLLAGCPSGLVYLAPRRKHSAMSATTQDTATRQPCVTIVDAPAKINLTPSVLGRRQDGYHRIESLVCGIGLYDRLEIRSAAGRQDVLSCDMEGLGSGPDNLVLQAVRALREFAGTGCPVDIKLHKSIPLEAGLGGGSSDAYATLAGLQKHWHLKVTLEELSRLASGIGSDVALFGHLPSCVIRERGESVSPCRMAWSGYVVLALPALSVSTARVYQAWSEAAALQGQRLSPEQVAALDSADDIMANLYNDLEAPAIQVEPSLGELSDALSAVGGVRFRMTGSGSAFFALRDKKEQADALAEHIQDKIGVSSLVVQTLV